MVKLSDHEDDWATAMRAANRGCAHSYAHLLRSIAAALRVVGARDLARFGFGSGEIEDVVQDCLLAVHLKRHTWDETRPFVPWVRAISRHKIIDKIRQRARAAEVPLEHHEDFLAASEPSDNISSGVAERYLASLPSRQRAVITALALDGATVSETAQKLDMSPGAVRVAMHRGLTALALRFGASA
jgi:RNA polymerase sigma-70 factor (ECF subfamily)